MVALDPVADVEVVDVLLADVVAAEPAEVVPVVDLVLHFVGSRPRSWPTRRGCGSRCRAVPVGPQEHELADGAVVDPLDGFDVVGRVAALEADAHLEALLLGQLVGLHELRKPGASTQHGFSMNTCLPALMAAA